MVEALGWHADRTKSSLEPSIFILMRPREVHLRASGRRFIQLIYLVVQVKYLLNSFIESWKRQESKLCIIFAIFSFSSAFLVYILVQMSWIRTILFILLSL
jgi:hypothetical protein